jgi:predicted TIM-barrel fold metal-dependent hydrolase
MTDRPPFVDTHVHFHDLAHETLSWVWLEAGWVHPILGDIGAIQSQRYTAEDFVAETRFQNVAKVIHVQAAIGSADPVDETRWLQEAFTTTGVPHGIVADAPLAADEVEAVLEGHVEASPNLRGIRDFGQGDYLVDPAWQRGYALLAKHDLVCCLDSMPETYAKARALAETVPDVTLCIDHTGFPRARDDEYFAFWRRELQGAAQAPSTVVKISGLGMLDPTWTVDSIRPWVETAIEAFGTERAFFGTNWPVDRMRSSYGDVLDAYWEIIQAYSPAERTALWSGNAERIFRL